MSLEFSVNYVGRCLKPKCFDTPVSHGSIRVPAGPTKIPRLTRTHTQTDPYPGPAAETNVNARTSAIRPLARISEYPEGVAFLAGTDVLEALQKLNEEVPRVQVIILTPPIGGYVAGTWNPHHIYVQRLAEERLKKHKELAEQLRGTHSQRKATAAAARAQKRRIRAEDDLDGAPPTKKRKVTTKKRKNRTAPKKKAGQATRKTKKDRLSGWITVWGGEGNFWKDGDKEKAVKYGEGCSGGEAWGYHDVSI
ncbi:hypothetical protein B0H11DRAFT_1925750 [Mycena galericulata]|nr:hypothetical protein B0H11DRAFT_1925750 [Mycena galericulata]